MTVYIRLNRKRVYIIMVEYREHVLGQLYLERESTTIPFRSVDAFENVIERATIDDPRATITTKGTKERRNSFKVTLS